MDRFYTPTEIAARMVQAVSPASINVIADFAVGDGELIRVARKKWPNAKVVATDINPSTVSRLNQRVPTWKVGRCDFLSRKSRARCKALKSAERVSLVLINPPFSCRGARKYEVEFRGSRFNCGLALAFVIESLRFLASDGQVVALLPAGCLTAVKDQQAWAALRRFFKIDDFGINGRGAFEDCHAETVIVRLLARKKEMQSPRARQMLVPITSNGSRSKIVRLFRGKVQMHLANGSGNKDVLTLIHTTELEPNKVNLSARKIEGKWRTVRGPAILLPRVGKPSSDKVKLYLQKKDVVLSDCVIALCCVKSSVARDLHDVILRNWTAFKRAYRGTCAKYITIDGVRTFVESSGFRVEMEGHPNGNGKRS